MEETPPDFAENLTTNWSSSKKSWSLAFRVGARIYGNNTNNAIESFFHVLKTAIRLQPRRAPHVSEFMAALYDFCCEKVTTSDNQW